MTTNSTKIIFAVLICTLLSSTLVYNTARTMIDSETMFKMSTASFFTSWQMMVPLTNRCCDDHMIQIRPRSRWFRSSRLNILTSNLVLLHHGHMTVEYSACIICLTERWVCSCFSSLCTRSTTASTLSNVLTVCGRLLPVQRFESTSLIFCNKLSKPPPSPFLIGKLFQWTSRTVLIIFTQNINRMLIFVWKWHFHWCHNDVIIMHTSSNYAGKTFNYPLSWSIRMVHAKNYENSCTILWDIWQKQVTSFSTHGVH